MPDRLQHKGTNLSCISCCKDLARPGCHPHRSTTSRLGSLSPQSEPAPCNLSRLTLGRPQLKGDMHPQGLHNGGHYIIRDDPGVASLQPPI